MTDGDRLPEDYGHILPPEKPRRFPGGVIVGVVIVIAFAGGLWYGYHRGVNESGSNGAPPLIKAAPGPSKVAPANPGGINIPNQKASVYDRLTGNGNQPTVEHLAPPPQQPMAGALPESNGGQATSGQTASSQATSSQPAGEGPASPAAPPPAALAKPPAEMPPPTTPAKPEQPAAKPAAPAKPAAAARPQTPKPARTAASGEIRAQIGAYRSVADASAEWRRLIKTDAGLMHGLRPAIRRVDLGARGVFQRLQAGPFNNVVAARRFCAELKAKGHGCFVVTH